MNLTDEPQFGECFKSAIYGNQPDAGVFLAYPLMYCGRSEMFVAKGNSAEYGAALRGNLKATLSQYGFNLLFSISNLSAN